MLSCTCTYLKYKKIIIKIIIILKKFFDQWGIPRRQIDCVNHILAKSDINKGNELQSSHTIFMNTVKKTKAGAKTRTDGASYFEKHPNTSYATKKLTLILFYPKFLHKLVERQTWNFGVTLHRSMFTRDSIVYRKNNDKNWTWREKLVDRLGPWATHSSDNWYICLIISCDL